MLYILAMMAGIRYIMSVEKSWFYCGPLPSTYDPHTWYSLYNKSATQVFCDQDEDAELSKLGQIDV